MRLRTSLVSVKLCPGRRARRVGALLGLASIASLMGICGGVGAPSARAQSLQPGEILLNDLIGSNIQRYSASGTLEQTYTGSGAAGNTWEGASITPDGNIVTTFRSPNPGIAIFRPDGTQLTSFLTPEVALWPGDVSVFADGTLAVSDQFGHAIRLYSQSGTLVNSFTPAGLIDAFGSTIGLDNTLWVTDFGASPTGGLLHFTESGTLLGNFSLSFNPGDVVVDPTDGSLWVAGNTNDTIFHLRSTDGGTISSFSTGLSGNMYGIGISPDGKTLYATTDTSTIIKKFDTTGLTTGSITISNPNFPLLLTVVPNAAPISVGAPEPGSIALFGLGCSVLGIGGLRIRRRKR